jgi:hypothetical protein
MEVVSLQGQPYVRIGERAVVANGGIEIPRDPRQEAVGWKKS